MKRILLLLFLSVGTGAIPSIAQMKTMCVQPTITVSADVTICSGDTTILTATVTSGGAPFTYDWTLPAGLGTPNNVTAAVTSTTTAFPTTTTTYTIIVTDTPTCTSLPSFVTVTVRPTPTVTVTNANPNPICSGQTLSLTASATGSPTYSWTGPNSFASALQNPTIIGITIAGTGTYSVTATEGGCTNTGTVTVTVNPSPTVTVTNASPNPICSGQTLSLTASATGSPTYSWTGPNGFTSALQNPTIIGITTAGTGTYSVTATEGGCSNTGTVTVTVNPSPTVTVTGASPNPICSGQTLSLTASATGSPTYSWTGPNSFTSALQNPTISGITTADAGTYSVTATEGGCTNTGIVTVTVNPTPIATATAVPAAICTGQSTTLTASGGGTYSWWNATPTTATQVVVSPIVPTTYTVTVTSGFGCTSTGTVTVAVGLSLSPTITGLTPVCDSTTLDAGGGYVTYTWTPAANTQIITVSTSGIYSVTVTDASGCSGSASFTLTVNPTPTVTPMALPLTICNGDSTVLSASGGTTYSWLNATPATANPVTVFPAITTTYTVIGTSAGCDDTNTVVVTVNPTPIATATAAPTTICIGSSTTLTASGGGTYSWNTGPATSSITVSPTTNTGYTVIVTSGLGCTSTATVAVSIGPSLSPIITGPTSICSGNTAMLNAGAGYTSYTWTPVANTQTITVSTSGTYSVIVADASGCSGSTSHTLTVNPTPTVTATPVTTICNGESTTLTASGGTTYSWLNASPANANPVTVSPAATTTYTVVGTSAGCADTNTVVVTVNLTPIATATAAPTTICLGASVTLTAGGGGTYSWSPPVGSNTQVVVVTPGTTGITPYTVTVTGVNTCTATAVATVNVVPAVNATISCDTICEGEIATLTASGGGTYSWNTGPTTSFITVSPTTNTGYTVTVSNSACSATATCTVQVSPNPTVTATAAAYTINIGGQTTLTGITSTGTYNWSPTTGLSCPTCPNPVANPTVTTIYTLTTTDVNGCTGIDTVIVFVTFDCGELFVPSAFSPDGNLKNDFVTVRSVCIETIDFTIYNRWGQIVYRTDDPSIVNKSDAGWDGKFNGKECDPAVYFYILNVSLIPNNDLVSKKGNVSLVR